MYNNVSDHVPLRINLNIDLEFHKTCKKEFEPAVQCYKCDEMKIRNYKYTHDQNLIKINPYHEALWCKPYKCTKLNSYTSFAIRL